MVLKIQNSASEHENDSGKQLYLQRVTQDLVNYKIDGLLNGYMIPDDMIAELEVFMQRNSLKDVADESKSKDNFYGCCPKCLKAHIMKTAKKMGIDREATKFLEIFIEEEAGHEGYYLDGEELVKI